MAKGILFAAFVATILGVTYGNPISSFGNSNNTLYLILSARDLPPFEENLINRYVYAVLYRGNTTENLEIIGETERVKAENNVAKWNKVFKIQYKRGQNQKLFVEVHHNRVMYPDEKIAESFIDLDRYVQNGQRLSVKLNEIVEQEREEVPTVTIMGTTPYNFTLAVYNIPPMDWFGGFSDPFVKCYFRDIENNALDVKFHVTPYKANADTASWDDEPITFFNYIRGTKQRIHFKVMDHDSITKNDFIGDALLDADELVGNHAISTQLKGMDGNVLENNVTLRIIWKGWA